MKYKGNSYLYETSKTNLKLENNHLIMPAERMVLGTHPWFSFKTLDPLVINWTDNRERSGYPSMTTIQPLSADSIHCAISQR